jgi:hypothetical protein
MKIKIISDRKPWVNDKPWLNGEEVDVSAEDGLLMIEKGFAEDITPAPAKGAAK